MAAGVVLMSRQAAGERFRKLHVCKAPLILPNPADAGTARLLEMAGFKALGTTSAGAAFAAGVSDGQVARAAMMRHIAELARSTSLPLTADLGDGFGRDPETVAETIRMAAAVGAVGGSIEDASGELDDPLLPVALATERIIAAAEAARALPFTFTLTARADNFLVGRPCLDDAAARLAAYREAGADVLYAPGIRDEDEVAAVIRAASGTPVNVLAQPRGIASSIEGLASLGVRRISLGSALTRAAFATLMEAIAELKAERLDFLDRATPLVKMNELFRAEATSNEAIDA